MSDDVLKARLKTVGVCEYTFEMEASAGAESGVEWRIIDVGGSRSQRRKLSSFLLLAKQADNPMKRLGPSSLMTLTRYYSSPQLADLTRLLRR